MWEKTRKHRDGDINNKYNNRMISINKNRIMHKQMDYHENN